jgi:hypothetical protein
LPTSPGSSAMVVVVLIERSSVGGR